MKRNVLRIFVLSLFMVVAGTIVCVKSNVSAASYVYDYWKNIIPSSEGITYKETYYNTDITYVGTNESIPRFGLVADLEVFDSKIYIIDQYSALSTPVTLGSGVIYPTGVSKLIILNQNFQCEQIVDEFLLSDHAKTKLDDFYAFTTPLDEISESQYTATEFVDVYTVVAESESVKNNRLVLSQIEYDDSVYVRGSSLTLKASGEIIDPATYNTQPLTAINFSVFDSNAKINEAKVRSALNNAGITIVSLEATPTMMDSLVDVKGSINYNDSEEATALSFSNNALKQDYESVKVYVVNNNAEVEVEEGGFEIDPATGKFTLLVDEVRKLTGGSHDIRVELNLGSFAANDIEVLVARRDEEASLTAISNLDKTIELAAEGQTYVLFNQMSEGTNVEAVYKYISSDGRAPYVPYSKDATKAAIRLNEAMGVTVTKDYIYICDTKNARILKCNYNFEVIDLYLTPDDSAFYQITRSAYDTPYGTAYQTIKTTSNMYTQITTDETFTPKKLAITPSGVCYCISANIYEGLIEFGVDTEFNRFLGKNTVAANALKQFWSKIWSETQYASQALDLPAMFNNISISSDGFLYATSDPDSDATAQVNMVKIINTKGVDIMKRNGYVKPDGDAVYVSTSTENNVILGSSVLTAVAVSRLGNFSVTDSKRGRIFTYDSEGNLLYITGEQPGGTGSSGQGGLSNSILNPVAIDYLYRMNEAGEEEETVIVLDQNSGSILLYETTEFGSAVNQATYLYQNGVITDTYKMTEDGEYELDENGNRIILSEGAESYWRRVIKMNTNYELAYLGIGKALLRKGEYKEAMRYFKLAHNGIYYSKAFSAYRDQVLSDNFNLLMAVIIAIVILFVVSFVLKRIEKRQRIRKMKGAGE